MDGMTEIESVVLRAVKARAEVVDRLCEIMLTTPNAPGISVRSEMKDWKITTTAELDPEVPFGEIHYHDLTGR